MLRRLQCAILALAVLLVLPALAQNTPPPPVCETTEGFADFDFWVGEWDVYSNDEARNLLGHNSITRHYGDCLIMEQWQGASGGAGTSMNYFNNVTAEWRQVWVANGYSIDYTGGLNDEGSMVLEGYIYNYRQAAKTPFRGIWTPQDDGSVVQHFDIYNADNDEWSVWFEGLYVPSEKKAE